MGWGSIVSGGTAGSYTLALDFGVAQRDAWLSAIDGWIDSLNVQIAAAEARVIETRDQAAAAEAVLQALLEDLASATSDSAAQLQASIDVATQRYAQAQAAADAARIPRELMIAERATLAARKNTLQSAVVSRTLQAWCVDYTEDAAGFVATIEIPGEDRKVLIAPGGRSPTAADGALMARELMTPEQAFLNAALLPGWQKWKPTFRAATITWLDAEANLANVSLDAATSSAANLPINQTPQLSGIPFRYMDCDAVAFSVGDRVVVEFQGQQWEAPRIIGFVESPKPCRHVFNHRPVLVDTGDTKVSIRCMLPGLYEALAACDIDVWINGVGPYRLAPIYSESVINGAVIGDRVYLEGTVGINIHETYSGGTAYIPTGETFTSYNYALEQVIPEGGDGYFLSEVRFTPRLRFFPPGYFAAEPGNDDAFGVFGAVEIFMTSYLPADETAPYWKPPRLPAFPQNNICEFVFKSGGATLLHVAASDGNQYTDNKGLTLVKGIPIKTRPGLTLSRMQKFGPEYSFAGS